MKTRKLSATGWLFLFGLTALSLLCVHAQSSRAAMASAYIARGSEWQARGEYERALADFDLAITTQ